MIFLISMASLIFSNAAYSMDVRDFVASYQLQQGSPNCQEKISIALSKKDSADGEGLMIEEDFSTKDGKVSFFFPLEDVNQGWKSSDPDCGGIYVIFGCSMAKYRVRWDGQTLSKDEKDVAGVLFFGGVSAKAETNLSLDGKSLFLTWKQEGRVLRGTKASTFHEEFSCVYVRADELIQSND